MKRRGYLFAVLLISCLVACGGGGGGKKGGNETSIGGPGIYVAGNYYDESKEDDARNVGCVWKITESGTTETALTNDSYPESIYVYNGTVYVSGTVWDSSSESQTACCWIISGDGTVTKYDLEGGLDAPSIYVHNGTAYIAGSCGTNEINTACYWTISESGTVTRTDLAVSISSDLVYAKSIFVNDDAIYIAGNFYNTAIEKDVACCWEIASGKATTGGITPSYLLSGQEANGIVVKDGTIYISGEVIDYEASPATFTGVYWVIPPESEESYTTRYDHESSINSYADTISVASDGTVYTAGRRNGWYPCYWTGTEITELGTEEGEVSSISASGSTVYMAGNYKGDYDGSTVEIACIWMTTTSVNLTDLTDKNISGGNAAALFVVK